MIDFMQKNYIFQIQNAIYQTLVGASLGVDVILTRGLNISYPHVIVLGTKKSVEQNLQIGLMTDIQVNTKDISLLGVANIVKKIEDCLNVTNIRKNLNFYTLNFAEIIQSEVSTDEYGCFCGKIMLKTLVD